MEGEYKEITFEKWFEHSGHQDKYREILITAWNTAVKSSSAVVYQSESYDFGIDSLIVDALAAIELPEQDLPNWDDAPEWADRLMHTPVCIDYWCNDSKFKEVADITNYGSFGVTTGLMLSDMTLIEMRPIAIEDKEWLPSGRCNHMYDDDRSMETLEEVSVVGIDKDGFYVYQTDRSTCYYSDPASEFRPLKTAEELKEEAFKAAVSDAIYKSTSTHYDRLEKISSVLFKAGFEPPSGDE